MTKICKICEKAIEISQKYKGKNYLCENHKFLKDNFFNSSFYAFTYSLDNWELEEIYCIYYDKFDIIAHPGNFLIRLGGLGGDIVVVLPEIWWKRMKYLKALVAHEKDMKKSGVKVGNIFITDWDVTVHEGFDGILGWNFRSGNPKHPLLDAWGFEPFKKL